MKFEVVAVGELKPDLGSRLIQLFQRIVSGRRVDYSHLAVIVDDTRVFDATGRGVAETTLEELLDKGDAAIRKRFLLPLKKDCCGITWLRAKVGVRYSNIQYLGFLFPLLRFLPGVRNGAKGTICSEFVADFVRECGDIPGAHYLQTDFMSPHDVVSFLEFVSEKKELP